VIENFHF